MRLYLDANCGCNIKHLLKMLLRYKISFAFIVIKTMRIRLMNQTYFNRLMRKHFNLIRLLFFGGTDETVAMSLWCQV